MKLYRPFVNMGDMVWPSAVQPFQATTWTLGTEESHTQSSPVHVNCHEITQLKYNQSSVWYVWIRLTPHTGHLTVQTGKDTYCNKDMCQASKRPSTNLGYDISFSEEILQNYMDVKHRERLWESKLYLLRMSTQMIICKNSNRMVCILAFKNTT